MVHRENRDESPAIKIIKRKAAGTGENTISQGSKRTPHSLRITPTNVKINAATNAAKTKNSPRLGKSMVSLLKFRMKKCDK